MAEVCGPSGAQMFRDAEDGRGDALAAISAKSSPRNPSYNGRQHGG
jgi:hypothetical protein